MRILIYSINYAPEQIGVGKYTGEMATWLVERGHQVHVVAPPPYYPQWRLGEGHKGWGYKRERLDGVDVWRCPLWVPRSPWGFTRMLYLLTFAVSSLPVVLGHIFWRPDVIFLIEPPLFCAPQALFTARLSGAKAWLHVQDFEVAVFLGLGFSVSGLLKQSVLAVEGWIMRRFDQVSSISRAMLTRVSRLRVPEELSFFFPNWVDTRHIRPNPEGRDFRSEWGFTGNNKIILYSGNMGNKQGLDLFLDAAAQCEKVHPEAAFVLVGEGAAKADLVAESKKRKLENIVFKPLQPLEDLPSLLAMADIHLVIQKRGVADAVMPSKLTGILAVGGFSIITADNHTELGQFVLSNPGIAELVEPENKDALIAALSRMISLPKQAGRFNSVARTYAEQNLDVNIVLIHFEQRLLELIGQNSS